MNLTHPILESIIETTEACDTLMTTVSLVPLKEGVIIDAIKSVIEWFKTLLKKIFDSSDAATKAAEKNDKKSENVSAAKQDAIKLKLKYNGFKFTYINNEKFEIADIASKIDNMTKELKNGNIEKDESLLDKLKEDDQDFNSTCMAKALNNIDNGNRTSIESTEEFNKELFKIFRNGKSEKEETNAEILISDLMGNYVKELKGSYRKIKTILEKGINDLEDVQKDMPSDNNIDKGTARIKQYLNILIKETKFYYSCITMIYNAQKQACTDAMNQDAFINEEITKAKKGKQDNKNDSKPAQLALPDHTAKDESYYLSMVDNLEFV